MSSTPKKLFLLDAYALIFRAHFAFSKNPRINSDGLNTGVMLGFTNSMLEVIQKQNPSHLAVAFDTPKPTFRHKRYPQYKAHREATPEDIKVAVPYVKKIIRGFNVPILEKDGYEADDVIGTVAKKAAKDGFEVYMMTPDKDYAQLVDDHIFLYKPAYMGNAVDILGVQEVLKKWDISRVDQVRDVLGLHGDASDNIPGIPGVGAKTAIKYLKAYDNIEGLLENIDELKGKAKENVINYGQQGLLSKELATIETAVPLEIDYNAMEYTGPDENKLKSIFSELEFRTITQRLFGDVSTLTGRKPEKSKNQLSMFSPEENSRAQAIAPYRTIDDIEPNYQGIENPEELKSLVQFLSIQKEFCFDTETTNINPVDAQLVGMSFSYVKGDAYYVPVPEDQKRVTALVNIFKEVLENNNITKIGQNIKYDILVLKKYGVEVSGPFFDTMIAHYLIDPESKHGMDRLAERYLHYSPISIKTLIGGKGKPVTMRDVPVAQVVDYASEDADITLQLKHVLANDIRKLKLEKLFFDVELPLVEVLAQMEFNGVRIDPLALNEMSKTLLEDSRTTQDEIYALAGEEFNIASPKQLGVILFEKMKIMDKPKKTKTGQYATGEEILSRLAKEHEIAAKILAFREFQKLKSTYVDALPGMISSYDEKVHTNYNQTVAATGRLSSLNPNLQNIPIRTKRGREIRKAFIPSKKGNCIMSADYSQIELRIMASFSGDRQMIEAFQQGRDIHATTAARIFKVAPEEVTTEMRGMAKSANFGIIYGISAFGLSQNLSISRKEAAELIDTYFSEFSSVKKYMDQVIEEARENEYVSTILGRRRYLRDINSQNATMRGFAERNAINAPIQGTAADIIKVAMINIHSWMKKENIQSKMIMQVHDELVFDVVNNEKEMLKDQVEKLMKEAIPMEVPMEVGIGFGDNWLEAH